MLTWPHRLADGTQVLLRPIRPDDKPRLSSALERLSPESRRLRFLAPKPRLSSGELRYLTEVDGDDHVALVAVLAHRPDVIVGVARFVRAADDPRAAEIAVVVGDPWQRQGLGRHLGSALAAAAREHGVERFTAVMDPENRAAHRLLRHVQAELAGSRVVAA